MGARRLLLTLFATGLLGIGYEVLIIRMLSQILENTVYTFASVLSVYLLGTAGGGWLYQAVFVRRAFDATLTGLLIALSLACLGGVGLLWIAEPTYQWLRELTGRTPGGGVLAELLHPDPRRALFLGLGTGATFAGVLAHPDLVADGVELVPEVVEVMPYFDAALGGLRESDRVRITVADARRFVRASARRYDVIVADVFHPSRDGAGSLYTVEHFRAIRGRLAPGGLFCQWLPLFQLDLDTLRMIVRTFLDVFPGATAHLAHYSLITPMLCLVGSAAPRRYPEDWFSARKVAPPLSAALAGLDLDDEFALFGTFVGGAEDLARFGGDGPLNTDDRPLVTFRAPRAVYGHLAPTWGRLKAVIEAFTPAPEDVLAPPGEGARAANRGEPEPFARRLAAYWRARDGFLAAGTAVTPTRDTRALARQISGPLLAIVRQSPDFTPAYRPLLRLARDLSRSDPEAAGRLLRQLQRANPRRDDARRLYAELFPRAPHELKKKQGAAEPRDQRQETEP